MVEYWNHNSFDMGSSPIFVNFNLSNLMNLLKLKPNTSGTRHAIKLDKSLLLKNNFLFKNLIHFQHSFQGRSSINGRITVRHKGGGCSRRYRSIDFSNLSRNSIIIAIAYDPNRTAFISLNFDLEKKNFFTTIANNDSFTGFTYCCSNNFKALKLGYRTSLQHIPAGTILNNLSINSRSSSKYSRAAGTSSQIIQKTNNTSKIRLPSGTIINLFNSVFATLGTNSNIKKNLISIGKAGKNRLRGIRPTVRGIAMNPIDHPHGGRTNSGFVYVTPWGIHTKGKKTRKS